MTSYGFNFENSYLSLPDGFYSPLNPVPVSAPEMVILNTDLAASLGLDFSKISEQEQAALFAGNNLPEGSQSFAQAYAGHQFGHFTMLGDGRAHVLGEHVTPSGDRFDIQFKGSGRTPYSRRGDGRAALGPMLREYMISEAMHALGISTTRSLAVVTSGEEVYRETALPGAILTRIAASHIRVGTFEFAGAQGDPALIETLLDYTINRHDPGLKKDQNKALAFLQAVMERQADLITQWMRVGFIHGVMNTDNMTISGETIDYGPCAFMDAYDPNTVFSSIDHRGRYAYANQPVIGQWNLSRLAEALLPLIDQDDKKAIERATQMIGRFPDLYKQKWLDMMRAKLGLFGRQQDDTRLISDVLNWMQTRHADYTNTFRDLSTGEKPEDKIYSDKTFQDWFEAWQARLQKNDQPLQASVELMQKTNPAVIPRNHNVEDALDAATAGDLKPFYDLLTVLIKPYEHERADPKYQDPPASSERVYQTFCGT